MTEIEIKGLKEKVFYDKCDNGLRVYMWVNPKVNGTFMSLAVKYGSVDTEFIVKNKKHKVPGGIAHFLEHIKFNEENGSTAHDFYHKTGAEVNAFTTFEYTSYFVYALKRYEDNLKHLLDFVQMPYFTKELIEKEKGIIIEEEKMGEDDPDTLTYFGIFKNLFEKCKYKDLVTGKIDEIKDVNLKDIEKVYREFYHPENMFMVITGNLNPYETMEIIKNNQKNKIFEQFNNPKVIVPKEGKKVFKIYDEVEGNVANPRIKVALKISRDKFTEKEDVKLRAYLSLIMAINFGSTSEFKYFLLENKLITYMTTMLDIYDDYIVIIVSFESRFYEEVIKRVKYKLSNLEIDEKTFERKLKAGLATLILGYDDIEKVNYNLQDNIIYYDKVLDNIKEINESITMDKLNEVKNEINTKNLTVHVVKPKKNSN